MRSVFMLTLSCLDLTRSIRSTGWILKSRPILMLGEKLAELVSLIGEDKTEAQSAHSAMERNFHVCHLN